MTSLRFALLATTLGVAASACTHGSAANTAKTAASTAREKTVTLLHIADTHAQLETHPEYMPGEDPSITMMGGYARLRTALDAERAKSNGAVFVADGGDTFQGSGPAAWSEGEAVLGPFNALGVDVCVPGNWEVVYGPERFVSLMSRVSCDVVAYNFHAQSTGARLFAPMKTLEREGVRVTFIGIADPTTTTRQPPEQVAGLDSTRMEGLRSFVQAARSSERADLIVAVTHTGLTLSRQLAREIPELDVILSGHTHERTERPVVEGKTVIVEPGSLGSFLGRLDLTIDDGGGLCSARMRCFSSVQRKETIDDAQYFLCARRRWPDRAECIAATHVERARRGHQWDRRRPIPTSAGGDSLATLVHSRAFDRWRLPVRIAT